MADRDDADGDEMQVEDQDLFADTPQRRKSRGSASQAPAAPADDDGDYDDDDEIARAMGAEFQEVEAQDDEQIEAKLDADRVEAELAMSEAGIIQQIVVKNWLCHDNAKLVFKPGTNFITGRNGSGKSAILVALTIGLGGKAQFVNRGKIGDMVKNDRQKATIEITIRNEGVDAYRPEDYGKSITVVRTITKSGVTAWRVKSDRGQIDNPVAVLMQDTSRQFLSKSNPNATYQLFMKATQLEQMINDYNDAGDNLKAMGTSLVRKSGFLTELRQTAESLEQEADELSKVEEQKMDLQRQKRLLAWSYVVQLEQQGEALLQESSDEENRLEQLQKELVQSEKDEKSFRGKAAMLNEDAKEITARTQKFSADKNSLEARKHEVQKEVAMYKRLATGEEDTIKGRDKRRKRLQAEIDAIQNRATEDTQREVDDRQQQITAKEEQLAEVKAKLAEANAANEAKQAELRAKTDEIGQVQADIRSADGMKAKLNADMQRLKGSQNDKYAPYGPMVGRLVAELQKPQVKGMFEFPVYGPLGSLLTLREPQWGQSVQSVCNRVMQSFLVGSHKDEEALIKFVRKLNMQVPQIIVQRYKNRLEELTPNRLPDSAQWKTMLDIIQCDVPDVLNAFIIQCKIELRPLVKDMDTANELVELMKARKKDFRNVHSLITTIGEQISIHGESTTFRPADSNALRVTLWTSHVDIGEHTKRLELEIKQIDTRVQQLKAQADGHQRQRAEINKRSVPNTATFGRQEAVLMGEIRRLRQEMQEAQNQQQAQPDDEVPELQRNIQKLDDEDAASRKKAEDLKKKQEETLEKLRPIEEELARMITESEDDEMKAQKVVRDLGKINESLAKAVALNKQRRATVANKEGHLVKLREQYDEVVKQVVEKSDQSSKVCNRPTEPIGNKPDVIRKTIERLQQKIEVASKGARRPYAQVREAATEARSNFLNLDQLVTKLGNFREALDERLKLRMGQWVKTRRDIAHHVGLRFSSFLSHKGYTGMLSFDHDKGTLTVVVNINPNLAAVTAAIKAREQAARENGDREYEDDPSPKRGKGGKKGAVDKNTEGPSTTAALSGGERSYSTVSLLLSLWDVMECPFRAMDEFDVFMDAVNRKIAIDLLLRQGRRRQGRQHIFVTPNNIGNVGNDTHVMQLKPPVRGPMDAAFGNGNHADENGDD